MQKRAVEVVVIRQNLHGSHWCFFVVFWCEECMRIQHVCCRKQVLQLVAVETMCMMLTCFYQITSRKCSWGSVFYEKRQKQQNSIVVTQWSSSVVVLETVCTWRFSLSCTASIGWLNQSMVPLPSCVMAPRGNRRGKALSEDAKQLTNLNFTIWHKCFNHWIMHYTVRKAVRGQMWCVLKPMEFTVMVKSMCARKTVSALKMGKSWQIADKFNIFPLLK